MKYYCVKTFSYFCEKTAQLCVVTIRCVKIKLKSTYDVILLSFQEMETRSIWNLFDQQTWTSEDVYLKWIHSYHVSRLIIKSRWRQLALNTHWMLSPCRCRTGALKKPTKCLWRWEPDRMYNFFSPPARLCRHIYNWNIVARGVFNTNTLTHTHTEHTR